MIVLLGAGGCARGGKGDPTCDGVAADAAKQHGVCAGAKQVCSGTSWIEPDYTRLPSYEDPEVSCDGLDNDCDGETDEALTPPPASKVAGVCAGSIKICGGPAGWLDPDFSLIEGYLPVETDACDGLDNDCDGYTDLALTAQPASKSVGVCTGSVKTCSGIGGWVDPDFTRLAGYAATETGDCDGLDNDCDGAVDEQYDRDGDGYYSPSTSSCQAIWGAQGRLDCNDGDAGVQTCVLYVNAGATGSKNGTSWANACDTLQAALSAAAMGSEIWVAAGTYYPGTTRSASFTLKPYVGVYGGFSGTETSRAERDLTANTTVLSGDIGKNDGPGFANSSDNSYHVVTGANHGLLDGFVITAGNASSSGGGIYCSGTSPTIRNCTITANQATTAGGGMYNYASAKPIIVNTRLFGNRAPRGSAVYGDWSSATRLYGCLFSGNNAGSAGTVATDWTNGVEVVNCTFANNSGGALTVDWRSSAHVANSVFWSTGTPLGGEGDYTIESSCGAGAAAGGNVSLYSSPFVDLNGENDIAGDADDRLELAYTSPCVNAGNDALVPPELTTDLAGARRSFGDAVDCGAFEATWPAASSCSGPPTCKLAGVCGGDVMPLCEAGHWTCTYGAATYEASENTCWDHLDNDCDGVTDELTGCTCSTEGEVLTTCDDPADQDACKNGYLTCRAGVPVCEGDSGYYVTAQYNAASGYSLYRYTPGCPGGTELHVFGVYHQLGGSVTINVQRTAAAVILVLSAYDATTWNIQAAPGARIQEIIVNGYNNHVVQNAGAVPVITKTGASAWVSVAYRWPNADSATLVSEAERYTGLALTTFVGTYESSSYTVDDWP